MNTENQNYYSISDLGLACTISLWHQIESIDKTNPRKAFFIFKRSPQLDQLVESYWRKELQVEPQAYFTQMKALKTRIYERDDNSGGSPI